MPPKARAKSTPKAKGKAGPDASPKPKAKGKAAASAKAAASPASSSSDAQAPSSSSAATAGPPAAVAAAAAAVSPPAAAVSPPAIEPSPSPVKAEAEEVKIDLEQQGLVGMPSLHLPRRQETPRTKRRCLEEDAADPWAALSDEEAMAKVSEEAWDHILDNLDGCSTCAGPAHVVLKDGNHTGLRSSAGFSSVAISLDMSENAIAKVGDLPALWVRNLGLASNPLQSLDGMAELFPRLLSLDLSFVDIPSLEGAWDALAQCSHLRSLVAESAGVCSFEDMSTLAALETLELVENSVEELEEIEVLAARCPSLLRLDLRENPVASEFGYAQAVKKHLPKLVWRDNQSLRKYVAKGIDKVGYKNLNAEVNAVDGLYKNEHCSCLEGNPCVDPATCVDWEHREAVAAEARKQKGLRDDSGKQL